MQRLAPAARNALLGALPVGVLERLLSRLEPAYLPLGTVLHEAGSELTHVYFPTTAIVSLLNVLKDGDCAGVAIAGIEALFGIAAILGGRTSSSRAVVQCAGDAFRISADALVREFERGGELQALFLRYLQALIVQMVQTAACSRHHSVRQQFCRWLLLSIDRLPVNAPATTAGLLANFLGARAVAVNSVVDALQAEGLLRARAARIRWAAAAHRPALSARGAAPRSGRRRARPRTPPRAWTVRPPTRRDHAGHDARDWRSARWH
jgi:CRP-like cAMP-binding protein